MLSAWWAPALAFAAGVVSFASPCVFPLVPGYLSFIAGGEAKDEEKPIVPMQAPINNTIRTGRNVINIALPAVNSWLICTART